MNFMMSLFVSQERLFSLRFIYDLTFFLIVIVIIFQNLIFGVIIDTFADFRAEKNRKEEQLKNDCFICGEHLTLRKWEGGGERDFCDYIVLSGEKS